MMGAFPLPKKQIFFFRLNATTNSHQGANNQKSRNQKYVVEVASTDYDQ
jgi:hypothetical protein